MYGLGAVFWMCWGTIDCSYALQIPNHMLKPAQKPYTSFGLHYSANVSI